MQILLLLTGAIVHLACNEQQLKVKPIQTCHSNKGALGVSLSQVRKKEAGHASEWPITSHIPMFNAHL